LIQQGVRGNKKSESEIRNVINEIRKMITLSMPDKEIIERLKIPKSTFYRYKSRIYNEDRELSEKVSIEPIGI
jgi:DNA invertase Pin-like site-specific DNA recombinase